MNRLPPNGRYAGSPRQSGGAEDGLETLSDENQSRDSSAERDLGETNRSDVSAADEKELVDRCLNGEEAAWSEIHLKCHDHIVRQIRRTLGDQGRDTNLVDEIAARVWYGLVADDGYLLDRFQPQRGNGLPKYLAAVARFEVLRHQRSEYRRRRREQDTQVMRSSSRDERSLREMAIDVGDFLPQLTPREMEFFHHVLLGNNGHHLNISAPNAWQLRHRIRKKLLGFLDLSDKPAPNTHPSNGESKSPNGQPPRQPTDQDEST